MELQTEFQVRFANLACRGLNIDADDVIRLALSFLSCSIGSSLQQHFFMVGVSSSSGCGCGSGCGKLWSAGGFEERELRRVDLRWQRGQDAGEGDDGAAFTK
jgi:hypothetical protein